MIKKFNTIKSLAIFKNFSWDANMKLKDDKIEEFNKINIFYGRNYSGKTTLSRIIRTLETGIIPLNYTNSQFSLLWKDGTESTNTNLQGHKKTIRVFNKDFVRENLNFLIDSSNSQGQIKPFAITIIGDENVRIEDEIRIIKTELGNLDDGNETGLYAELKMKQLEERKAVENYQSALDKLQKQKHDVALDKNNGIKYNSEKYGYVTNYTIPKLDEEILLVLKPDYIPINDTKEQELLHSINQNSNPDIPPLVFFPLEFQSLSTETKEAVERKIGDFEDIKELSRSYALNEWVKKGCEFHKNKREQCAFCGNTISSDRWNILEKHFNEETKQLEEKIKELKDKIGIYKQKILNGFNVSENSFYDKFQEDVKNLIFEYKIASEQHCRQLDTLIQQLEKRNEAITLNFAFAVPENVISDIETIFSKYETIRKKSNAYTDELSNVKKRSKETLRLHRVRTFVDDIRYCEENERIIKLDTDMKEAKISTQKIQSNINEKLQRIEALKRKLNDEEKGALKVNEYLNNFFGHQFLTLKAITDENSGTKQIYFEIMRGEEKAFNLSEGECSLIAFCYFIAKLDDVITKDEYPIIWIDDPISSLDGNHIFFVYSLLRAEIVDKNKDKNKFEQLFVSTHNLEFLKYLKQLTKSEKTKKYFLVERICDNATIKIMPEYLKEYITEFNYLFHQIYKCANATINIPNNEDYVVFYNFGNNLRKFLEIYTYYKYPDGKDSFNDKIHNLFGDKIKAFLIDRICNECSHLSGILERGAMPVEIPEMKSVAQEILKVLENADPKQYKSFMKSIGENYQKDNYAQN